MTNGHIHVYEWTTNDQLIAHEYEEDDRTVCGKRTYSSASGLIDETIIENVWFSDHDRPDVITLCGFCDTEADRPRLRPLTLKDYVVPGDTILFDFDQAVRDVTEKETP